MATAKACIRAVRSPQNVLILKGIVAADALKILDELLQGIRKVNERNSTLQLWDIFSLICASGAAGKMAILLGPAQQTLEECREFLQLVEDKRTSLSGFGSDFESMADYLQIRRDVKERLVRAPPQGGQCEAVVWDYYYADESPKEIKTAERKLTLEDYFWKACCVREYPPLGIQDPNNPKFPWHSLIKAAKTDNKLQGSAIYVSIRTRTENPLELASELVDLKLEGIMHYPFFVDGPQRIGSKSHDQMMEAAVMDLDRRLGDGQIHIEGPVLTATPAKSEGL
ncbi:hypothetical protein AA0119_g12467 [Alternaria tenuissima]|nr:hypothetical protein AA0119_g12467 [Alternaria tenuissima]RYO48031.1 hypothetical protein AA0116_g12836 [Alternaria tenuissima]